METVKSPGTFGKIGRTIDQRPWLKMLLIVLVASHAADIMYSAGNGFIHGFRDGASGTASPR